MLLDEHVDTGVRDSEGLSPAMWACRSDRIAHFHLLSSYEQEQNATRQRRDCRDVVDSDGYERDLCGRTWLHWSVRRVEPLECLKVCLYNASVLGDSSFVLILDNVIVCFTMLHVGSACCFSNRLVFLVKNNRI